MFTIRINTATDVSTNLGIRHGFAMTLIRDTQQVSTYWGGTVGELFKDYLREFADEDMWDRDEAKTFLFLTEILELATLYPKFDVSQLPIEMSCNS